MKEKKRNEYIKKISIFKGTFWSNTSLSKYCLGCNFVLSIFSGYAFRIARHDTLLSDISYQEKQRPATGFALRK